MVRLNKEIVIEILKKTNINPMIVNNLDAFETIQEVINNFFDKIESDNRAYLLDDSEEYYDAMINLIKVLQESIDEQGNFHCQYELSNGSNYKYDIFIDEEGFLIVNCNYPMPGEFDDVFYSKKFHPTGIQVAYEKNGIRIVRNNNFVTAKVYEDDRFLGTLYTRKEGLEKEDYGYIRGAEQGLVPDIIRMARTETIIPPENSNEWQEINEECMRLINKFIKDGIYVGESGIVGVPNVHKNSKLFKTNKKNAFVDVYNGNVERKDYLNSSFINYGLATGLFTKDNNGEIAVNEDMMYLSDEDFEDYYTKIGIDRHYCRRNKRDLERYLNKNQNLV